MVYLFIYLFTIYLFIYFGYKEHLIFREQFFQVTRQTGKPSKVSPASKSHWAQEAAGKRTDFTVRIVLKELERWLAG